MRRVLGIVSAVLLLPSVSAAQPLQAFEWPDCPLAIADIVMLHDIDANCGLEGDAQNRAEADQNRAKNNFCAQPPAANITRWSFVQLQRAADCAGLSTGTPPHDRSVLRGIYTTSRGDKVGEGSLVQFVGFILEAHYSNVTKGESVNCRQRGRENNDIHLILDERASVEDFCLTVTARISPHYRPEDWESGVLEELERPVRVTGQLFFDGSHLPCRPDRRAPMPRVSVWEIHPVYWIDVCRNRTLQDCPFDDENRWTPLDEFQTKDESEHEKAEAIEHDGP